MVCFAIRAGKLQALRQPSNKIARLAFALPLSVLLFLPCHLSRFMFSPVQERTNPGPPFFSSSDRSSIPLQKKQERARRSPPGHFSALLHEQRGVGNEMTDPHPSASKRQRMEKENPGIGSVSENSLMLQAAARIKQLEVEVDSVASHLERLQEAQSSNGGKELDKSLEDQNVHEASLGEGFEPTALDLRADGHKILRDVLPLPSKARGTRLLELASQYMSELTGEKNMKRKQVDEHCARTVVVQPVPEES